MSRRRAPETDDEETSIYESKRPKKETKRGHELGPEAAKAIRVVSMKTPAPDKAKAEMQPHAVKIRALSEVSGPAIQIQLGNLAPPRDQKEVVKRRARDFLIVGLAVAIVGAIVMLGVVLLAR